MGNFFKKIWHFFHNEVCLLIFRNIQKGVIYFKAHIYKNKIFLFGTPIHGNLGDQAIVSSEIIFLKENLPKYHIIEVESKMIQKNMKFLKKIVDKEPILVHGGGYLGTLWLEEEMMFRNILSNFKNNKIIVFPQTIFFCDDKKAIKDSKIIYNSHNKLKIFCREKYSYNFMKKNFSECDTELVPDIVLYNNKKIFNFKRNTCLFCIRNDKEKTFNDLTEIINYFNNNKISYKFTDTVLRKRLYKFNRNIYINRKLKQFSKSKMVITDRLHGMVFAYLTNTPCLVLNSTSYKILGVYKWIEKCEFIRFYNNETIGDDLEYLLNLSSVSSVNIKNSFISLIKSIKKLYGEARNE